MNLKKLSAHQITKKIVLISFIYFLHFFLNATDRCSPRSGRGNLVFLPIATIVERHHISRLHSILFRDVRNLPPAPYRA